MNALRIATTPLCTLLVWAGHAGGVCSTAQELDGSSPAQAQVARADGVDAHDWVQHDSKPGVSLSHPRGWRVRAANDQGQVEIVDAAVRVVVWPIFVRGPLERETPEKLLRAMCRRMVPQSHWQAVPLDQPRAVKLVAHSADLVRTAGLAWSPSKFGNAAFFYLLESSPASYARNEANMVRLLQSVRVRGSAPSGMQRTAAIRFVDWHDPNENAFSAEVPADWKIGGGMRRVAAVDTRFAMEAVSPDGLVRTYVGDAEIPPYTVPNQLLQFGGFSEGAWYSPGFGVTFKVARYLPGAEFATEYARSRAAGGMDGFQATQSRPRADVTQNIQAVYQKYSNRDLRLQFDAGEARYTCRSGRQPLEGYAFAGTLLVEQEVGGMWSVDCNYGFLAPPERVPEAAAVLSRTLSTYRLNAHWVNMQSHLTANVAQIVSETGQHIAQVIDDAFQFRRDTIDEHLRRYCNAILEVEDAIHPVTGEPYRLESGNDFYWVDPRGNTIGTDVYQRPDIDFQALIRLP